MRPKIELVMSVVGAAKATELVRLVASARNSSRDPLRHLNPLQQRSVRLEVVRSHEVIPPRVAELSRAGSRELGALGGVEEPDQPVRRIEERESHRRGCSRCNSPSID